MQTKLISFIVAEAVHAGRAKEAVQSPVLKSAPYYFEASVPRQFISSQEKVTVSGQEATLTLKIYKPNFLLVEVSVDGLDIFSDSMMSLKEEVLDLAREALKKKGGKDVDSFSEEYSVYIISGYKGEPEQFFEHKEVIAGLLKSEKLPLDPKEIDYTLSSSIKYAKNDLIIVDWDGAFIFDPDGDYESTLELLELANLQLLKYRILDKELDERLKKVVDLVEHSQGKKRFFSSKDIRQFLKETMLARSTSISEFQALDRDIKLIGDWYSARLYDLVVKKFKLDDWRHGVKDKLDALEDVYAIASQNFTITWEQRSRIIEMAGWYILLVGWLALLVLDIYFYRK